MCVGGGGEGVNGRLCRISRTGNRTVVDCFVSVGLVFGVVVDRVESVGLALG